MPEIDFRRLRANVTMAEIPELLGAAKTREVVSFCAAYEMGPSINRITQ